MEPKAGVGTVCVEAVSKYFRSQSGEPHQVLEDVSLTVSSGEFVCLIGPSGCGKSTLLNLMAGVVLPSTGTVTLNGAEVTALRTDAGYMRQNSALFPWRTVRENVAFGLEVRRADASKTEAVVDELLIKMGMRKFGDYYPHQLSGGMKQRVSLARTLAVESDILLMDEPYAALDAQTRDLLEADLLKLQAEKGMTVVFVTHDLAEAIALADRVVLLEFGSGRCKESYEVPFEKPRDPVGIRFTAEFQELYRRIWEDLRQEVAKSRAAETGDEGPNADE